MEWNDLTRKVRDSQMDGILLLMLSTAAAVTTMVTYAGFQRKKQAQQLKRFASEHRI